MQITAVVNTYNAERTITRCLTSVNPYVDEIVVMDMDSTDETRKRARKFTSKIYTHKYVGYVEPARNAAIKKARGEWILVVDADEVLPESLGLQLRKLAESQFSYYRVPRKNIIFNKWIRHSQWWPDYKIRFFKKDAVLWEDKIHSIPITQGTGTDLEAEEANALTHFHYETVEEYLERLNRYTSIQAQEKTRAGEMFAWQNLIQKPTSEFLTRFFAEEGYKDGAHGLALSLLQSLSALVVEVKIWQHEKFKEHASPHFLDESMVTFKKTAADVSHWYETKKYGDSPILLRTFAKIRRKVGV